MDGIGSRNGRDWPFGMGGMIALNGWSGRSEWAEWLLGVGGICASNGGIVIRYV